MQQTNENNHALIGTQQFIAEACLGVYEGAVDLVKMIAHPIDEVLYPISILAYDIGIVVAATMHESMNENSIALYSATRHSSAYRDAVTRMRERRDSVIALGQQFACASAPEKTRMLTHIATVILAPGSLVKGIKAAVTSNHLRHLTTYVRRAPSFPDTYQTPPLLATNIQYYTMEQIRNVRGTENFLYVITEHNQLLLTPEYQNVALPPFRLISAVHHNELGRLMPVRAAGEARVTNGFISLIDNEAGRYRANGVHLQRFIETTFKRHGFAEALGKFIDRYPITFASTSLDLRPSFAIMLTSIALQSIRTAHAPLGNNELPFLTSPLFQRLLLNTASQAPFFPASINVNAALSNYEIINYTASNFHHLNDPAVWAAHTNRKILRKSRPTSVDVNLFCRNMQTILHSVEQFRSSTPALENVVTTLVRRNDLPYSYLALQQRQQIAIQQLNNLVGNRQNQQSTNLGLQAIADRPLQDVSHPEMPDYHASTANYGMPSCGFWSSRGGNVDAFHPSAVPAPSVGFSAQSRGGGGGNNGFFGAAIVVLSISIPVVVQCNIM